MEQISLQYSNIFVKQYEQKASLLELCRCKKMSKVIESYEHQHDITMKINRTSSRLHILFLLLVISIVTATAQENLKINTVFEKYGKQKGATMVVLSGKALHNYRLDKYRSITIHYNRTTLDDIQQCLENDKKQARQIKEVISNGIITSGYYQLPEQKNNTNRYILFKIGDDGTATLIYMEGGKDSEELINRLFIKQE